MHISMTCQSRIILFSFFIIVLIDRIYLINENALVYKHSTLSCLSVVKAKWLISFVVLHSITLSLDS